MVRIRHSCCDVLTDLLWITIEIVFAIYLIQVNYDIH